MDRLFGKELSNLIEPFQSKNRHLGRIHSQSTRGVSEDVAKVNVKRCNRSSAAVQNIPKVDKKEQNASFQFQMTPTKAPVKDLQGVEDYFEDCYKFMMRQEGINHTENYMPKMETINERMRGILIDWLIDLHHKFKMFPQTLYVVVMIIDKYISKKGASKENLQLIGTAAFFIAAKYE